MLPGIPWHSPFPSARKAARGGPRDKGVIIIEALWKQGVIGAIIRGYRGYGRLWKAMETGL